MEDSKYNELESKSDLYISNILKQPKNYTQEVVDIATTIYADRGLGNADKQRMLKSIPTIKRAVYEKMKYGNEPEAVMKYMSLNGVEGSLAKEIARAALVKLKAEEPEQSKGKGNIVVVVIIVFFVIRMILKF